MGLGQQGRYIGRVGALAVALGIGGAIVSLPAVADADTGTGNSGKTTSSAGKPASGKSARVQKPAAKPLGSVSAASRKPLSKLSTGGDPLAPVTESLSWAVLAVTRRDKIRLIDRGIASATTTVVPSAAPLAAGATASSNLSTAVRNFIDTRLPGFSPIADQLAPIVADGIQDLLDNGAISAEVQRLVSNDAIRQFVSTKIATALNSYFSVPSSAGTVVGNAAVNLISNTLGNAGVQSALDVLANAVRPTEVQYAAITTALAANDIAPLSSYLKSVVANSSPQIATFLSDAAVRAALASATASAVIDLTSGPAVPTWLGDVTASWVSYALGGTPAGSAIGNALGDAVQGLLSNTKAMEALGSVAGAAVSNLLGTPGVSAAAADFLTQFASGVLGGANWLDALDVAWQGLIADEAFRAALGPAAGDVVYALATNSDVVAALSSTVTGLVNDLAGNADVRALLGEVLGSEYGPTLVSTLADPTSAAQLAATAGAVITRFLGQPGVAASLSATADQIVTALLAGAEFSDALSYGLQSLVSDPALVAAFNATVPDALKGVLKAPAVRNMVSDVAQGLVANLLDKTPLNFVATSGVTKAAVDALVSNPAAQNLIGDLASQILNGTPPEQLVNTVVSQVVNSQALQVALGQAIGQGFGALLGDNPVAFAVGQLAGVGTALFLVFAFGAANIFGLTGGLAASAVPSGSSFLLIPVAV